MDIAREGMARQRRRRRLLIATGSVVVGLLITLGLSRLKPAAPTVDGSTLWRALFAQRPRKLVLHRLESKSS